MVALETPVLSIAIDAVSKVDGEDALCGLITLFSKCKSGIQDGPRLENMAWRLWHVERFERSPYMHHLCFPASPGASSPGGIASPITSCPSTSSSDSACASSGSDCSDPEDVEHWDKDELTAVGSKPSPLLSASPSPLSDVKEPKDIIHSHHLPLKDRKSDMDHSLSPPSRRNSRSRERPHSQDRDEGGHSVQAHQEGHQYDRRPSFSTRRTYSNTSVGKIMADLLPEKLDVMELESKRRRPSTSSTNSAAAAAIALGSQVAAKELSEEDRWRASTSTLARDDQEPEIVTVVLADTPQQVLKPQPHPLRYQQGWDAAQLTLPTESASGTLLVTDTTSLPNVVIVHPTPHHTPPMTPQASPAPAFGPAFTDNDHIASVPAHTASPSTSSHSPSLAPAAEQQVAAAVLYSGQVRHDREQRDRGRERERERDSLTVPTRAQARQAHLLVFTEQRHPPLNSDPCQASNEAQYSVLTKTSITPSSISFSPPEQLSQTSASDVDRSANLRNLHVPGGLQTRMSNSQRLEPILSQLPPSTELDLTRGQQTVQTSCLLPSAEARSNIANVGLNTRREGGKPARLSETDMGESTQGAGLSANSSESGRQSWSEDGRQGRLSTKRDDNAIDSYPNAISNLDLNVSQSQSSAGASAGRAPTTATNGQADQHQKDQNHRFFIPSVGGGSQDGDSPETSASSQVGSHSVVSGSVSVTNSGFTGEPASVASRTSTTSHTKSTSSGRSGSSRGGLKMRSKTSDLKGKGKGKEVRLGPVQFVNQPTVRRSQSGQRIYQQVGDLGTVHRSLMGGRTAAATTLNNSLRRPMNNLASIPREAAAVLAKQQQQAPQQGQPRQSQKPQLQQQTRSKSPASSKASRQAEKSAAGPGPSTTAATGAGGLKSPPSSGSGRRNSSHSRSHPRSASGSSRVVGGLKSNAPSTSTNKHRLEMVDDSEYSTDEEEWDTEDCSEDVVEGGDTAADDEQHVEADSQLAAAAAEAQRHRDLFAKVDRRSYTQLNTSHSGLLSQIFHPPPERFPLDHPYRHSRSTQDILAHVTQGPARQFYMPGAMMTMQSKGSIATPTATTVVAPAVGSPNNSRKSPLRKPPQDAEMESDSGDDTENKLDMSKSLAQKKLQEHMTRSSSRQRQQQQQQQAEQSQIGKQRPPNQMHRPELPRSNTFANPANPEPTHYRPSGLHTVATAPIDLGYPYNLPPPMPPSTPRTTRRTFLTNELSESLRRNLLWERQVSRRPTSTRLVRPLTAVNGQNGNAAEVTARAQDDERAKQARKLARNKSWQEDFHGAGW